MTNASNTLYDSPVILYITIPKASPDWSIFDAGLFAENIMLAATAYGLGTIPTYNSVRFPAILHQTLNVPDDERFILVSRLVIRLIRQLMATIQSVDL